LTLDVGCNHAFGVPMHMGGGGGAGWGKGGVGRWR